MSNQEPDGWVRRLPSGKLSSVLYDLEATQDLPEFTWEPICLISPQELSRLRAIEEWANWASQFVHTQAQNELSDTDWAKDLIKAYDAINWYPMEPITEAKP